MKVLVACEFSGIVREAFAKRGHYAVSCDLLQTEIPGRHYQEDVLAVLERERFDLMIAHPPCTHLAVSGARWFKYKQHEQFQALEFVRELMAADVPKICVENPVSIISTRIRKPDQTIQPWMFGHPETKKTCLWLKNLPHLKATNIVSGREGRVWKGCGFGWNTEECKKARSRTYQGVADAMAEQWGQEARGA